MTWAEFQIRAYGWRRNEERTDLRFREVAYHSHIGGSLMLKKIPSKNKFWKIGSDADFDRDEMFERIREAQEQYLREKEAKNGKR